MIWEWTSRESESGVMRILLWGVEDVYNVGMVTEMI